MRPLCMPMCKFCIILIDYCKLRMMNIYYDVIFLLLIAIRYKTSKELVTHDTHNNSFIYKHSFAVEVLPICRDDVVFITKSLSNSHGGIAQGPLICYKLTQLVHLIDPFTLQTCDISAQQYNREPFPILGNSRHLHEYIVVNIEPLAYKGKLFIVADSSVT